VDKAAPAPQRDYLTCEEAGHRLNLSPRTLEKYRTIGGGPTFRKLGRRVMYKPADLDAWTDARSCESTSDPVYVALRQR
jgi:helix-turn-helix protein